MNTVAEHQRGDKIAALTMMLKPHEQSHVLEVITSYLAGDIIAPTPEELAMQLHTGTVRDLRIGTIVQWLRDLDHKELDVAFDAIDEILPVRKPKAHSRAKADAA